MPLWTANDDATGRPKYANTSNVYGVDRTEAHVRGLATSPGWVQVDTQYGYVTSVTVTNGGSGYTNSDTVTFANGATDGTGLIVTADGANTANLTLAITASGVNAVATGTDLDTLYANSETIFFYTNSTNKVYRRINKVTNSTSMNVVGAWGVTNTAVKSGFAAKITSVGVSDGGKFSNSSLANSSTITSSNGVGGVVTLSTFGGRIDRYPLTETLVYVKGMAGDAEDTVFPDS